MPSHIEDEAARLAVETGKPLQTTKKDAGQGVERTPLDEPPPRGNFFRERLREFYEEFPLPEPTGLRADKAFFDEMSGEFD